MSAIDLNNLSIEELKKIKNINNTNSRKSLTIINNIKKKQNKTKPKQHIKKFEEYFQECIKNKTIPDDTPPYLKKALERALKEYQQGIKKEKSALENFAEEYVILKNQHN